MMSEVGGFVYDNASERTEGVRLISSTDRWVNRKDTIKRYESCVLDGKDDTSSIGILVGGF